MTNGGWTHGPWRWDYDGGIPYVQRGASGGFVVKGAELDRCIADARLIAAAPDLYEALDEALDWMETVQAAMHRMEGGDNFDGAPLSIARTALAKARGESKVSG